MPGACAAGPCFECQSPEPSMHPEGPSPPLDAPFATRIRMMTAGSTKAPAPSPPSRAITKSTRAATIRIWRAMDLVGELGAFETSMPIACATHGPLSGVPRAQACPSYILFTLAQNLPNKNPLNLQTLTSKSSNCLRISFQRGLPAGRSNGPLQEITMQSSNSNPPQSFLLYPFKHSKSLTRLGSKLIGAVQGLRREQLRPAQATPQIHAKIASHLIKFGIDI